MKDYTYEGLNDHMYSAQMPRVLVWPPQNHAGIPNGLPLFIGSK